MGIFRSKGHSWHWGERAMSSPGISHSPGYPGNAEEKDGAGAGGGDVAVDEGGVTGAASAAVAAASSRRFL